MNRPILGFAVFPCLIVLTLAVGLIGQSCAGPNPPFAPFGSTVTISNPLGDFFIPPDTLAITQRVQAFVQDPDGNPLNDVRVRFSLSFGNTDLDNVIDTDGDGLGDEAGLQLVDPDNCIDDIGVPCDEGVDNFLDLFEFGGTVSSPYTKLSDNRGIAEVFILISGDVIIDPAGFEASLDNGSVANFDFGVNVP